MTSGQYPLSRRFFFNQFETLMVTMFGYDKLLLQNALKSDK